MRGHRSSVLSIKMNVSCDLRALVYDRSHAHLRSFVADVDEKTSGYIVKQSDMPSSSAISAP